MIDFTYRKNKWRISKDSHNLILSKLIADEYTAVGYYSCPKALIRTLVKEHLITTGNGKDIQKSILDTCNTLGEAINTALNAI